jgi:hypothetical protein
MAAWFCAVGGTIRALAIRPSAPIWYRWYKVPRGASVTPCPAPARGGTAAAGGSGGS